MIRATSAAIALSFALAAASPLHAESDADHVLDAVFQSFDEDHDGVITSAEANRFIDKSFAEMDRGKTGKVSLDAWLNFSFGLADVAADEGRSDAYDRAKTKIFKRWALSNPGGLTLEEYRAGVLGDAGKVSGGKGKNRANAGELRLDLAAFKRAAFVRAILTPLR